MIDSIPTQSPQIEELMTAILQAQRELEPVKRDSENPYYHSRYASLAAVNEALAPFLAHDLVITFLPWGITQAGHLNLITRITHAPSCQWIQSLLTMPIPKDDPQGVGSAISYARRYAISCLTNLVTEDDDANQAQDSLTNRPKDAAVAPRHGGAPMLQSSDASAPPTPPVQKGELLWLVQNSKHYRTPVSKLSDNYLEWYAENGNATVWREVAGLELDRRHAQEALPEEPEYDEAS